MTIPTTRHNGDGRNATGYRALLSRDGGRCPVEQSETAVAGDSGGANRTTLRSPRDPTTVISASGGLSVGRGWPDEMAVDTEPEW